MPGGTSRQTGAVSDLPTDVLAALADLPGVPAAVERARDAGTTLRRHPAMRRRWAEVRLRAGLEVARGSATLDGARVPAERVRAVAAGARDDDPTALVVRGAVRAQATVEHLMPALGAAGGTAGVLAGLPLGQLLARLHAVAAAGRVPDDELGRPRGNRPTADLAGLGPAPAAAEVTRRLGELAELTRTTPAPAAVLAALVHGELLALRPFTTANGVVARAAARLVVTTGGLDPTGCALADCVWVDAPLAYQAAAAGFVTGEPDRVAHWLVLCADAVADGAHRATALADEVLTG